MKSEDKKKRTLTPIKLIDEGWFQLRADLFRKGNYQVSIERSLIQFWNGSRYTYLGTVKTYEDVVKQMNE